jgi:3-mercaptopyruvate sulfurtransferase SseA
MCENSISPGASRRGDLFFAVGLIVVSAVAGFAVNAFRTQPLPLRYLTKAGRLEQSVAALAPSKTPESPALTTATAAVATLPDLSLEEFVAYTKARRGLVLDARPEIFYRLGHVPYAISLPRDNFTAAYALVRSRWETDRTVPLVIYCSSPTCEDAGLVQTALRKLGFTHVAVFRGGWAEWTAAHLEEERGP